MNSKKFSKAQFVYLVKHNAFVKYLYVRLGSMILSTLGKFVKTDPNLVLFVPNTGASFSGSPRVIYEYIKTEENYSHLKCIWAFNEPEKVSKEFELHVVKLDSISYFLYSLRAKYWVADINIERGLHYKKKDTIYLNTWHGVALKKIGNDDPKSAKYDFSNLNFLCISGSHDKKVFKSALKACESSFLECGMPRNDRLFNVTSVERQMLRKKLGIPSDKKVIAYIPTWRDSTDKGKTFSLKIRADFQKWESELSEKYILIFRAHQRTNQLMDLKFTNFLRNYSDYNDLNDILIVADVLITDYSSVVFDYSILEKPFICFAYDYEDYLDERGFYFDPEKVYPQGIIKNEDDVLFRLKNLDIRLESQKTADLKRQFMSYSSGDATRVCVEKLFGK